MTFVGALGDNPAYATFFGRVNDGPTPLPDRLTVQAEEGLCRLLVPDPPFCDPECVDGLCTGDNECTPDPSPVPVGAITVEGLDGEVLTLEVVSRNFQTPTLSAMPCAPGEPVRVTNEHFSLEGSCIEALEVPSTDPVPILSGQATDLAWTAPADPSLSTMHIVVDISHHGGRKGEIECEVPDTGSYTIAEQLVSGLVALGVAGFPSITFERRSTTNDESHPDLTLTLKSLVERPVDSGMTSCLPSGTGCPPGEECDNLDCPPGSTCDDTAWICK